MNQSVDYPILKIGDDSSAVFLPDKDGYIYFEVWNLKSYFRIYTKNNSLHLTTVIRNLEGKAIASVVDNEWEKIKLAEGFDFNNDNSGFEIIEKGDRNVIFQIDLRNGVAYFSGFIIDSDGSGICLTKLAGSTIYNTAIVRVVPGTKVAYPKTHIKPLFKYPRERYLGIRND
jgi:hypothetical protein